MDRFRTLRLILRFGAVGAVAVSVFVAVVLGALLWPMFGWLAVPVTLACAAVTWLAVRSYVEIIAIVMEIAH